MQDTTLLKISLICSIIGIFILLLINENLTLSSSNISQINSTMLDKDIKIKGSITKIKETPGLIILEVQDSNAKIPVIVFKDNQNATLKKGYIIEVEGTVTKYQDLIEIQAKRIKII